MLKLEPVSVENAADESKEALQSIAEKDGFVPNLFGTFAHTSSLKRLYWHAERL